MDPKTILALFIVFVAVGGTINNTIRIFGLTKTTVVTGGVTVTLVSILSHTLSLIGWVLFMYLFIFHGDYLAKIASLIF